MHHSFQQAGEKTAGAGMSMPPHMSMTAVSTALRTQNNAKNIVYATGIIWCLKTGHASMHTPSGPWTHSQADQ
jgi:hypothetical protein